MTQAKIPVFSTVTELLTKHCIESQLMKGVRILNCSDYLVDFLIKHGVTDVFGYAGVRLHLPPGKTHSEKRRKNRSAERAELKKQFRNEDV